MDKLTTGVNLSLIHILDDIHDTQDKHGTITCVAPFLFGARPADPVSASYLLLAQKCYEFYGNKRIIAVHFEGMKALSLIHISPLTMDCASSR